MIPPKTSDNGIQARLRDAGLPFASVDEALRYALQLHKEDEPDSVSRAEQIYRRVLTVEPDNPDALHYLGLVAHHFGQSDVAIDLMRRSIALRPTSARYYRNLAGVLRECRRYQETLDAYQQALALQPDFPEVQTKLAALYALLGRIEDAAGCYRDILARHPNDPQLNYQAALGFIELSDFEAALACAKRAAELDPDFIDAYNTLGILHGNRGEFEVGAALLHKALAINPRQCQAYYNLFAIQRVKRGDPDLAKLEALHGQIEELGPDEAVLVEFALGKAYEDIGDYDRAFGHFLAGNRRKRQRIAYSAEHQAAFFDDMCRVYDASKLERHQRVGLESPLPIFILGLSRSGTTLTERIVASHPAVHGGGEIKSLYQATDVGAEGILKDFDLPKRLAEIGDVQLTQIGNDYLARLHALAPASLHVTDKLPGNVAMIGLIQTLFPHAPMIVVRRDPIDVCVSCFTKLFTSGHHFTYDLAEIGEFYVMYDKLMRHWRNLLPPGRMLDVRYEDIVTDFEGQARRILDYCNLPWDDACLEFYANRGAVRTASLYQVRQPIYSSSVERWRRYEAHLQPLLKALTPVLGSTH